MAGNDRGKSLRGWKRAAFLFQVATFLLMGCREYPPPTSPANVSAEQMERIRQIRTALDFGALVPTWMPESLTLSEVSSVVVYGKPGLRLVYEGSNRERVTILEVPGGTVPTIETSRDDRVTVRGATGHYWLETDGYLLPLFWWYEDGLAILITYQGVSDETILRIAEGLALDKE